MSDDAAAEERRQKAAARQAKLLAKSKERLDKITGAAKGEGRIVTDSAVGIAPRPVTSNPPPPTSLADVNDDPAEVDLGMQNPLSLLAGTDPAAQNPFAAFGAGGGGAPGEDPFSQMMQQMMAGMGGAGGGPGGPGGIAGGQHQQQQPAANSPFAPAPPKTLLDRFFPLVHITSMVALAIYVVFVYEPARRMATYGWAGGSEGVDWSAWSALLTHKPRDLAPGAGAFRGLASVPLLWMFVTVELILQTTRLFLVRNRPAPPGILNSILPLISQFSPQIGLAIQTGVRYLDLFSTCLNDLAVLIFCIGLTVVIGRWKAGPPTGLVQAVEEKVNEALNRAAGDL
ncbi:hypothetical protein JCM8115_001740 [Rhodotorula mucilaginosa]|uniref:Golgi to ER traffic protein 2 n=1 Tax=Rhodotorula mucilaginosa TaxID=5537 RepID=A0A9P7B8D3_RHOMI|nr:hypothetical protein C6P46_002263 [Rhodotorula mucilaginosa]